MKTIAEKIETSTKQEIAALAKDAITELEKLEKSVSKDEADAEKFIMGTVEPIYEVVSLSVDAEHCIVGLVRGLVAKYENTAIDVKSIFNYLKQIL